MKRRGLAFRAWTCVALALASAACGDDKAGPGGVTESPNLGAKGEQMIVAADGGKVELKDAGIVINVPAGG
jgi:hypothetical protein